MYNAIIAGLCIVTTQRRGFAMLSRDIIGEDLVESADVRFPTGAAAIRFRGDQVKSIGLMNRCSSNSFVNHVEKRMKKYDDPQFCDMDSSLFFGDHDIYRFFSMSLGSIQ